eukprot:m.653385 g.653385  ORF g.653385 m.653385 type:complete len:800 (+) comp58403_c0_seq3:191-2590(+)
MSQTWRQKRDMEDLKRRDRAAYDKLVAAREKALGALGKFDENLQDLRQHLKQNPTAGMPSLSDVMSGNIELSSESEGEEDPDKLVQGEPAPSEPATNETQGHEEEDEDDEFERRARLRRESKSSTSSRGLPMGLMLDDDEAPISPLHSVAEDDTFNNPFAADDTSAPVLSSTNSANPPVTSTPPQPISSKPTSIQPSVVAASPAEEGIDPFAMPLSKPANPAPTSTVPGKTKVAPPAPAKPSGATVGKKAPPPPVSARKPPAVAPKPSATSASPTARLSATNGAKPSPSSPSTARKHENQNAVSATEKCGKFSPQVLRKDFCKTCSHEKGSHEAKKASALVTPKGPSSTTKIPPKATTTAAASKPISASTGISASAPQVEQTGQPLATSPSTVAQAEPGTSQPVEDSATDATQSSASARDPVIASSTIDSETPGSSLASTITSSALADDAQEPVVEVPVTTSAGPSEMIEEHSIVDITEAAGVWQPEPLTHATEASPSIGSDAPGAITVSQPSDETTALADSSAVDGADYQPTSEQTAPRVSGESDFNPFATGDTPADSSNPFFDPNQQESQVLEAVAPVEALSDVPPPAVSTSDATTSAPTLLSTNSSESLETPTPQFTSALSSPTVVVEGTELIFSSPDTDAPSTANPFASSTMEMERSPKAARPPIAQPFRPPADVLAALRQSSSVISLTPFADEPPQPAQDPFSVATPSVTAEPSPSADPWGVPSLDSKSTSASTTVGFEDSWGAEPFGTKSSFDQPTSPPVPENPFAPAEAILNPFHPDVQAASNPFEKSVFHA